MTRLVTETVKAPISPGGQESSSNSDSSLDLSDVLTEHGTHVEVVIVFLLFSCCFQCLLPSVSSEFQLQQWHHLATMLKKEKEKKMFPNK